jgi:hypothetical protein
VNGPFAAKHKLKTLKMKKLLQSHDLALTFEKCDRMMETSHVVIRIGDMSCGL